MDGEKSSVGIISNLANTILSSCKQPDSFQRKINNDDYSGGKRIRESICVNGQSTRLNNECKGVFLQKQ